MVGADAREVAAADSRDMNTILVAVDGSEQGLAALDTAVALAKDEGASLVCVRVISVLDIAQHRNGHDPVPPDRVPRSEDDGILAGALAVASACGVEATAELLVGYPPRQITRLADDIGADLIVVGSRGLGRVKSVAVGSTSREVVAHAGRPVLVVNAGVPTTA